MTIRQRIADWFRERRIDDLLQQFAEAYDIRDRRRIWIRLRDEINERSPEQVERMARETSIGV